MNTGSIEAIQTIICLNIYLNNNDKASVAKSMLGIAIRMALTLGLSVGYKGGDVSEMRGVC
jgi:hypothetical protein